MEKGRLMSYGYTLNLVSLNKSANARSLGVKLGRTCIKHGVSVADVAKRLGVSRQTIYHWFSGKTKPTKQMANKIEKLITQLER
jgi:DNA-binding XRE family transcriptional regulator